MNNGITRKEMVTTKDGKEVEGTVFFRPGRYKHMGAVGWMTILHNPRKEKEAKE